MTVKYKRKLVSDLIKEELVSIGLKTKRELSDTKHTYGVELIDGVPHYVIRLYNDKDTLDMVLKAETMSELLVNVELYRKFSSI